MGYSITRGRFDSQALVESTDALKQGRPVWRLQRRLTFSYRLNGLDASVTVPVGFHTDFASVPRPMWAIANPAGRYERAAIVHDFFYINKTVSRRYADAIFLAAMRAEGVSWLQRSIIYRAVRIGGGRGWGR